MGRAKKKTRKANAAVDRFIRPTPEREAANDFRSAGAAVRVVPVIVRLHEAGVLNDNEFAALAYYRDQASLAEHSPVRSCIDFSPRGGHGPGIAIQSAIRETYRMERDMGQLWQLCRAVCVDDVTLERWCAERGGDNCIGIATLELKYAAGGDCAVSRVETIGRATLYLGDCRDLLPTLPKVDAVVTDPPYGIGMDGGKVGKSEYTQKDWDSEAADVRFILEREWPAIIWGGNYFALPPAAKWLVWDKRNDQTTFADCELAWTNLPGAVRQFRWMWSGPYQQEREQRFHPTQKPLKLMKWCLDFLPKAETIFDPFMGSGTTGVAAAIMGKSFVGIERDPEFYDIACKRIEDAQRQGDFFINAA